MPRLSLGASAQKFGKRAAAARSLFYLRIRRDALIEKCVRRPSPSYPFFSLVARSGALHFCNAADGAPRCTRADRTRPRCTHLTAKYEPSRGEAPGGSKLTHSDRHRRTSDHHRNSANIKNTNAQKMTARLFFIGTWL